MAPRRSQPVRRTQANSNPLDPALIARRAKKHLDELERTNYVEVDIDPDQADGTAEGSGRRGRGAARQTLISDKRPSVHPNKKSTMNIRTALLYKKNLATLVEESGIGNLPPSAPSYLSAVVPPPKEPPRLFCAVCGYWGNYRCMKCAFPFCSRDCEENHRETQCEKRVVY